MRSSDAATRWMPGGASIVEVRSGICDRTLAAQRPLYPHKNIYLAVLVSMFLHGSWLHVLGNMLFLWVFGNNVEDRLGTFGFAVFYVLAGLVASAAHIAANLHSVAPFLGASGAIAGVMGAYLVFWPRARIFTILLFIPLYLPAWFVLGWLAAGMSHQEIISDYPELTENDIRACLAYAADCERRIVTAMT